MYDIRAACRAALVAAAWLSAPGWAGSASAAAPSGLMSGAELVRALEGKPADGAPVSETGRMQASARGQAYIAGVADATSGTRWCGAGQVLAHELTDRVYTHLQRTAPERLQGTASTLVIEGLAASFPCRIK